MTAALPNPDHVFRRTASPMLSITPQQAEAARREAFERYYNHPHADPRVGRAEYRSAIAVIDELSGGLG